MPGGALHRVARVDHKIDENLFDLGRVAIDHGTACRDIGGQGDIGRDCRAQHAGYRAGEFGDIGRFKAAFPVAAEGQKLLDQFLGPFAAGHNLGGEAL